MINKKIDEEFSKNAPKMPHHYEQCSYLSKSIWVSEQKMLNKEQTEMHEEGKQEFEASLTAEEINELFKTPHCLPMPSHVTL